MSIQLLVDSVDVLDRLLIQGTNLAIPVNGNRGVASLQLRRRSSSDTFNPQVGQSVELVINGVKEYSGTIDKSSLKRLTKGEDNGWIYQISTVTLEQRFDNIIVSRSFASGSTAKSIIESILANEASGTGVTAGTIQTGVTLQTTLIMENKTFSQVLSELARMSNNYYYYIRDSQFYFTVREATIAPFDLDDLDMFWGVKLEKNRSDYRNRQLMTISESQLPPQREIFQGDGSTKTFNTTLPIRSIVSIEKANGTIATKTGTFTGVPNDGDTITIDGFKYTWRTSNTTSEFNQNLNILIGANATECAANLAMAINDSGWGTSDKGTKYGLPTVANYSCSATSSSGTITLKARFLGSDSNLVTLSESCANFTWAGATLSGGVIINAPVKQNFGNENTLSGVVWTYTAGTKQIKVVDSEAAPTSSDYIMLSYMPIGHGTIVVEDTAAVIAQGTLEGSGGQYQKISVRKDIVSIADAIKAAQSLLTDFNPIGETLNFNTRKTGIRPGQMITISSAGLPLETVSPNQFMITGVTILPFGKASVNGFVYQVTAISGNRMRTPLDIWTEIVSGQKTGNSPSTTNINNYPIGGNSTTTSTTTNNNGDKNFIRDEGISFNLSDDTVGTNVVSKYFPVIKGGRPYVAALTFVGYTSPRDTAIFDVLYSRNNGSTWTSLFEGGGSPPSGYMDYPSTSPAGCRILTNLKNITLIQGDILRVDCLQSGGLTDIVGRVLWRQTTGDTEDEVLWGLDDAGQITSPGTNAPNKYFPVIKPGQPYLGSLVTVGAGSPATDLVFDVLKSSNNGATWTSICGSGLLVYPANHTGPVYFSESDFATVELTMGDMLRVDLVSGHAIGIIGRVLWREGGNAGVSSSAAASSFAWSLARYLGEAGITGGIGS